jgi:DNA topoisomerase-1
MRDKHARVNGSAVRFEFRGKHGIQHAIDLRDRRLARIVKSCRELPGYELFKYVDNDGRHQVIDSADVNAYLREISGQDFTAKDFRTWAGTVLAAKALAAIGGFKSTAEAKRNVVRAIDEVAKRLGNTKAVSRKCYIHPAILDAYMQGVTIASDDEAAVVAVIARRLKKTA